MYKRNENPEVKTQTLQMSREAHTNGVGCRNGSLSSTVAKVARIRQPGSATHNGRPHDRQREVSPVPLQHVKLCQAFREDVAVGHAKCLEQSSCLQTKRKCIFKIDLIN
jgi:hypothetical protein